MGEDYTVYSYSPNKEAPVLFSVLFAISTGVHIWQNFKYKCWKMTAALSWGGLLFTVGFAMREVSVFNSHNLGLFVAFQCLLLLAPPVYSLTNYLILGRILYYVPYFAPIHPGRVISTFVGLDLIVGIITGNGAAQVINVSNTPQQRKIGEGLIRTSILLQVVSFLGFLTLALIFHQRCSRAGIFNHKLRTAIYLLYASGSLILARNIYRVVETFQGYDGYVFNHEVFFYVFDGALMFINSVMLNLYHPMSYLPRSNKVYLAKDGTTELEGPGWVDKRPFLVTVLDPFDVGSLIKGKDKTGRFWEESGDEGGVKSQDEAEHRTTPK